MIDALGQQEVPDYFQQFANAIIEDVNIMKAPHAQEWIAGVPLFLRRLNLSNVLGCMKKSQTNQDLVQIEVEKEIFRAFRAPFNGIEQ